MISPKSEESDQARSDRRVSVVIPVYNAAEFIGEALESVFNQDYPDIEVIVVDDGSTDETATVLSGITDPRLRVLRQKNGGVSAARNRGIQDCKSSKIFLFDADDRLYPQAVSRLVACFDQDPSIVLAYGEAITFNDTEGPLNDAGPPEFAARPQGDALEQMVQANPISCCAVMVCRQAIEATGGFDTRISLGEDWLMWCKLAAQGRIAYAGASPIVLYRIHSGSAARRLAKDLRAMWPAIECVFALPEVLERFPVDVRVRLRRRAEATALAFAGRELLKDRRWQAARQAFWGTLVRQPTRIGEWILLSCALINILPNQIRRRIK